MSVLGIIAVVLNAITLGVNIGVLICIRKNI